MNCFRRFALICFLILIFYSDAHAYLDLGTGSYVLQVLLAFFLGAAVMFRRYLQKVVSLLQRIFASQHREH